MERIVDYLDLRIIAQEPLIINEQRKSLRDAWKGQKIIRQVGHIPTETIVIGFLNHQLKQLTLR